MPVERSPSTNMRSLSSDAEADDKRIPASLYTAYKDGKIRCNLCEHHCWISEGKTGICKVRENINGILYTRVYGRAISQHKDPIEKKPLYHFYPGSTTYSIATQGCNFRCRWCQNWDISQMPREKHLISGKYTSPKQIIADAQAVNCRSIAYTFTEPTIFFEYAYDIARLAHEVGLTNIFVTNGYMSQDMLAVFNAHLDAANVDLKAFSEKTYHRYVGARLQPVLDNLKIIKRSKTWLEVTTLVIPELNDSSSELRDTASFIAQELGVDTPWHISRFFPAYKMTDRPPTPMSTLYRAHEIALEEGLQFVYIGNSRKVGSNHTHCPACGELLIQRSGFALQVNRLKNGYCPTCGASIPGVGMGGSAQIN
jgi:pyruvate formate lyase activating enzyme